MDSPKAQYLKIFISYSHKDKKWLERLQVHLAPLARMEMIDPWDDTRINMGDKWHDEINNAMGDTGAAILMISANFLASSFIANKELPVLLGSAEQKGVRILPLIIGPSLFTDLPELSCFQSFNSPSEPLMGMDRVEQEVVLSEFARSVMKISKEMAAAKPLPKKPEQGEQIPLVTSLDSEEHVQRVSSAREIVKSFNAAQYVILTLVGLFTVIVLISAGKELFGEGVSLQSHLVTTLPSIGAIVFLLGRLLGQHDQRMGAVQHELALGTI